MKCEHTGCNAHAMKDDQHCYFHSQKPEIIKKREEARKRGGQRGKLAVEDDVETVEDVLKLLSDTLNELRSSPAESVVSKSRAIGYLCSILLTALEKNDMEERLCKLEEMLDEST